MRKYRTFLLGLFGIGVFLVLAFALTKTPTEPTYRGRRLHEWLEDTSFSGRFFLAEPSVRAVRAIGTNALPYLLAMLRSPDSPMKRKLTGLLLPYPHLVRWVPTTGEMRRVQASCGFRALGLAAKPAFPDIVKMVLASDQAVDAINALSKADPDAITLLARGLENKDPKVRTRAAFALCWLRQAPSVSVPALSRALRDPDAEVRARAAESLRLYGSLTNHIPAARQ